MTIGHFDGGASWMLELASRPNELEVPAATH
jgi:hypothetical protein